MQHCKSTTILKGGEGSENTKNCRDCDNRIFICYSACESVLPLWKTVLASEVEHWVYLRENHVRCEYPGNMSRNGHNSSVCSNNRRKKEEKRASCPSSGK